MSSDLTYDVTRIYLGEVDPNSGGVRCVSGRMELYTPEGASTDFEETRARSDLNQWSGEVIGSSAFSQPIGYFSLDGGVGAELESDEEGDTES